MMAKLSGQCDGAAPIHHVCTVYFFNHLATWPSAHLPQHDSELMPAPEPQLRALPPSTIQPQFRIRTGLFVRELHTEQYHVFDGHLQDETALVPGAMYLTNRARKQRQMAERRAWTSNVTTKSILYSHMAAQPVEQVTKGEGGRVGATTMYCVKAVEDDGRDLEADEKEEVQDNDV